VQAAKRFNLSKRQRATAYIHQRSIANHPSEFKQPEHLELARELMREIWRFILCLLDINLYPDRGQRCGMALVYRVKLLLLDSAAVLPCGVTQQSNYFFSSAATASQ